MRKPPRVVEMSRFAHARAPGEGRPAHSAKAGAEGLTPMTPSTTSETVALPLIVRRHACAQQLLMLSALLAVYCYGPNPGNNVNRRRSLLAKCDGAHTMWLRICMETYCRICSSLHHAKKGT